MTRWLALLLFLAPCSGCMMMDDLFYGEPSTEWTPQSGCATPPVNANAPQTMEPELLKY